MLSSGHPLPNSRLSLGGPGLQLDQDALSPDQLSAARAKAKKRDDAIRKRAEQDILKQSAKRSGGPSLPSLGGAPGMKRATSTASRGSGDTVASLRPAPCALISDSATIHQACQLMAMRKCDAVLCVASRTPTPTSELVGILTDKDIAYRVIAARLNPQTTLVRDVCTRQPITVPEDGNRDEALQVMVHRHFRHLPVTATAGPQAGLVGVLDITKCVFDRVRDLEQRVGEDEIILNAMEVLGRRGALRPAAQGEMLSRLGKGCPTLGTLLHLEVDAEGQEEAAAAAGAEGGMPGELAHPAAPAHLPRMLGKDSVRDAARAMKEHGSTALLIMDPMQPQSRMVGIITTKDIVLRVIAAGLDASTTSCFRVMTSHPDFAGPQATVLDALLKMHAGHYLHLPVVHKGGVPVGLVDVMDLTISMLNYLMAREHQPEDGQEGGAGEGAVWNRFWGLGGEDAHSASSSSRHDRHSAVPEEVMTTLVSPRHSMMSVEGGLNPFLAPHAGAPGGMDMGAASPSRRATSLFASDLDTDMTDEVFFGLTPAPGAGAAGTSGAVAVAAAPSATPTTPSATAPIPGGGEFSFKVTNLHATTASGPRHVRFSCATGKFFECLAASGKLHLHQVPGPEGSSGAVMTLLVPVSTSGVEEPGDSEVVPEANDATDTPEGPVAPTPAGMMEVPVFYQDDEADLISLTTLADVEEAVAHARRAHHPRLHVFVGRPSAEVLAQSNARLSLSAAPKTDGAREAGWGLALPLTVVSFALLGVGVAAILLKQRK